MSSRRRRRRRLVSRKVLIWIGAGTAATVLIPLAAILVLIAMVDANAYRSQLETALRGVIGRDLRIRGQLSVTASLPPKIEVNDITLPNMSGGSRADMVRIEHMTVELATWSLFTGALAVERIALVKPDVLFETDASGRANWRGQSEAGAAPPAKGIGNRSLLTVHVRDGRITWRDGVTGTAVTTEVRRLALTSASVDAPLIVTAELAYGRQRIALSAQTGPLARLFDTAAKTPWGLFVNLESGGAKFTVAGSLTRPLELKGYSLRLDAAAADLGALGWLLPIRVPPLRGVTASARVLDTGGVIPDIASVLVQSGFSNLDKLAPGLTLETLRIEMPRMSEPVVVSIEGAYASSPLRVAASLGAPSLLLPDAPAGVGYNVDIAMEAAGATLAARGAIADPVQGKGMDIALGARIPDLGLLGTLTGLRLPQLKTIAFAGVLADGPGGYRQEVALRNIVLTLPQGDLAGELALALQDRPRLRGVVKSGLLDLDGLLAAWEEARPGDGAGPRRTTRSARASDVIVPPPVPRRGETAIADSALPLEELHLFDSDIRATIDQMRLYGAIYRDIAASVVLSDSRLVAGPVTAEVGGGRAELRLSVDARGPEARVALAAKAQSVDLRPYLVGWGVVPLAVGRMDLDAELSGAGATWHDLAGRLDGHVALMLGEGVLDTRLARGTIADVLRGIRAGDDRIEAARLALRCLSLGLGVAGGKVSVDEAGLDSARFFGTASGTLDLGGESMALQLRPVLRVRASTVPVPLRLEGPWMQPVLTPGGRAAPTVAADACTASPFLRRVP